MKQVLLDGGTEPTACTFNVEADEGDRVVCSVQNHSWSVDSNVTKPASSPTTVKGRSDVENIIDEHVVSLSGIDVYYQVEQPTEPSGGFKDGDTWYKLNANGYAVGLYVWKNNDWVNTKFDGGDILRANSITANEIASNTITANKINLTDVFAQNITASGTITGVTLNGSTFTAINRETKMQTLLNEGGLFIYDIHNPSTPGEFAHIYGDADDRDLSITSAAEININARDGVKLESPSGSILIRAFENVSIQSQYGVVGVGYDGQTVKILGDIEIGVPGSTVKITGSTVTCSTMFKANGGFRVGNHSSDIGTLVNAISNTDTYSLNNDAWTTLGGKGAGYYNIPAGSWIITARVSFASNGTGRRGIRITNNAESTYGSAMQVISASSNGGVTVSCTTVISLSSAENVKIQGFQNSGGKLGVTTRSMRIMRIA